MPDFVGLARAEKRLDFRPEQRDGAGCSAASVPPRAPRQYGMDGVIMFSDILTPLPALGIEFDVVRPQPRHCVGVVCMRSAVLDCLRCFLRMHKRSRVCPLYP